MPTPTVYRRPESRWWWIARAIVEPDGTRRRSLLSGRSLGLDVATHSREQAQSIIDDYYRVIPESLIGNPYHPKTVGWFRDAMLVRLEREGMRDSTLREFRISLRHCATALGADTPLASLTRAAVRKVQDYLLDRGNRPASVNKVCRHIRAAFNRLVDDETLSVNPFARFRSLSVMPPERRHLTLDDLRRFIEIVNASPNEAGRRLVYISLYTGRRRREILELPRDAIDLKRSRILIMNVKHREHRRRWIPVTPEVAGHLAWFLEHSVSAYPLRVCHPDTYTDWVKRWLRAAGLPDSLHLHSLRHTFVTHALAQGIPAWHIKDILDHSSITVTEGYGHTEPEVVNIRYGFEQT